MAFAIAPNASASALGLRNLIHSTEPPPAPVFLSPLPSQFPLPSQLLSSEPVPSSSSSLSSDLSDKSDDDNSPSCPDEASSSVFWHRGARCLLVSLTDRTHDLHRLRKWGSCPLLRIEWHRNLLLRPHISCPRCSRGVCGVGRSISRCLSCNSCYPKFHHSPLLLRHLKLFRGQIVETIRPWQPPPPPLLLFVLVPH